jgi:penicillin amidase
MVLTLRMFTSSVCVLVAFNFSHVHAKEQPVKLPGLSSEVFVEIDDHGIPHVYAPSWNDAARVLGYLHAGDRLWQMDMFRRQASGTVSELLGKPSLESDVLVRRLGIRRTCEAMWKSGELPVALREELEAYAAGVNARIAELGSKGLPAMFGALGYEPAPWSPVDSLVFSKYMAWDQSGTDADLWFGMMTEKLGPAAVEELWPLERPYEVPTVKVQTLPSKNSARAPLVPIPGAFPAYEAALCELSKVRLLGRGLSFGSNNWAVDGTKTASGKPLLCSDPHLGFSLPSIWYTCHLSVRDENVAGVAFPGGPVVVIGHNDKIAWAMTNMQADAVDYFVETVDPQNPLRYQHRGEWKMMERVTEQIAVRGEATQELHIDSTVHGPIINRQDRTISLQWTGLEPTKDLAALWGVSHAKNLKQFLRALDDLTAPPLNMIYADTAGNIAIHPCGTLPLRLRGEGRIPMEGASGQNDWTGRIPRSELPLAINPSDHFVASANGRPAPLAYPHYLGWMWDCNYRIRRINELLEKSQGLTIETMKPIQLDIYDKAAERFLPTMLAALTSIPPAEPTARNAVEELRRWDYVATTQAIGPVIWLRWFEKYRDAVWNDEWTSRGISQPAGSWGFSGTNRREPMLEVLEYMTREHPHAIWFDDRSTPARESRDDMIRRSFTAAMESLAKEFGADIRKWNWGGINQLKVNSLTQQPELARNGGAVAGTCFTVNPGGDTGPVGAGASWRMIVDFAHLDQTVGVFPGGQSEDSSSPLYHYQIAFWAKGNYLPLHMVGVRAKLPQNARAKSLQFRP